MNGSETEYKQEDDGSWLAIEGSLTGSGATKEDAASALMKAKALVEPKVVSDLTLSNKAEIQGSFVPSVDRLIVRNLKNKTPNGMTVVAYYESDPAVQGYGTSQTTAKVDLFQKRKNAAPPVS